MRPQNEIFRAAGSCRALARPRKAPQPTRARSPARATRSDAKGAPTEAHDVSPCLAPNVLKLSGERSGAERTELHATE